MVCLIVNGKSVPKEELLCERLVNAVPEIASICLNTNTEKTNVIMGNSTRVLWGRESISDELCGIEYAISARSFYQVNPVQAEKLYSKAVEYAALTGKESVWDLYCGIGTISLCMAKKAAKVYGDHSGGNRGCEVECCPQRNFQCGIFRWKSGRSAACIL